MGTFSIYQGHMKFKSQLLPFLSAENSISTHNNGKDGRAEIWLVLAHGQTPEGTALVKSAKCKYCCTFLVVTL